MLVSLPVLVAGLRGGWVGSFPTDTVPALAVRPDRRSAIYELKQRPPDKPLILMASSLAELWQSIDVDHPAFPQWRSLAQQYLPGAVTLVLPANDRGKTLNPQFANLGIRIPNHQEAIFLLQQTGALLTTSANRSGQAPLTDMTAISREFGEVLVWAGTGSRGSGQPSTVLEWGEQGWHILRQGAVTVAL